MRKFFTKARIIKFSILGVIIIGIIITILTFALKFRIKASKLDPRDFSYEEGQKLNITDERKFEVYKNDTTTMYIDFLSTNIIVEKEGKKFQTIPERFLDSDITKWESNLVSPINISYIYKGTTNALLLNGYNESIKGKHYEVIKLSNGIRINYEFFKRTINKSWIPEKITREEALKVESELKGDERLTWRRAYRTNNTSESVITIRNLDQEDYDILYNIWTKKYNLTTNDLIKRAKELNYKPNIDKPHFIIPVEYRIDNDSNLLVEVLTDHIKELSEDLGDYTRKLSKIELLPNFLNIEQNADNNLNKDKFIFIPDGSGALIEIDKVTSNVRFEKNFYNANSLRNSGLNKLNLEETLLAPVYGISDKEKAIFANIQKGIGNAKLNIEQKQSSFTINTNYDMVIWDTYEFVSGVPITSYEKMHNMDRIKIKYHLITKENTTYYDFVKKAQKDFFNGYTKKENSSLLLLEVLGAFKERKHFLGIPYNKTKALTSYKDFELILEDLKKYNIDYKYVGFSSGGIAGESQNKIKRDSSLGSSKRLNNLINNDNIYFDTYISTHYKNYDNNFKNGTHGIRKIGGEAITFNTPSRMSLIGDKSFKYYMLNPKYLEAEVNSFIKNNQKFRNLALRDLGNTYLASYTARPISANLGLSYIDLSINKLNSNYNLMLSEPFLEFAKYATIIENMPQVSSKHLLFTQDIPFLSLVYEPYLNVYLKTSNMDSNISNDKMFLYAMLSNSKMKMTISKRASTLTKDSVYYNKYYSTDYNFYSSLILENYNNTKAFNAKKEHSNIKNHMLIEKDIFKVEYENGTTFIFNLSNNDFTYGSIIITKDTYKEI